MIDIEKLREFTENLVVLAEKTSIDYCDENNQEIDQKCMDLIKNTIKSTANCIIEAIEKGVLNK